ncbi:Bsp6I family restriction endonuclease [Bacillus toyonensis]|uniref:Bsp6I family type II restriction endonuclease n=1 Tax=Bacillus toyonensis TaxID=155322 RepID=UPI00087E1EB3|nr:Bsp6I family type II restriction endonuclease [Bacillus toyonensis]KAB2387536.1 Bsp6I family restriction endonuclease [Bacillus toyonensis]PGB84007.1 Bsp6I family restriction endonuclease [Bacillus toyonensis]SDL19314.1 Bsp6I restriction endonuclease [Bacillus toyonensis]
MSLIIIDDEKYTEAIELYFLWKQLNQRIRDFYTRGVNLPEAITETIVCYVNEYYLSLGNGSEDAVIPETEELVQVKASSNFDSDLTSFGPTSRFDYLHFVRLHQETDKMFLYDVPVENLRETPVNASQTFEDQQNEGRRPRFSIIDRYIERYNIEPYAVVDLRTGNIV